MTDEEFLNGCKKYLAQFSEGHKPIIPYLKNEDGKIKRADTLNLACFLEMPESLKSELLA